MYASAQTELRKRPNLQVNGGCMCLSAGATALAALHRHQYVFARNSLTCIKFVPRRRYMLQMRGAIASKHGATAAAGDGFRSASRPLAPYR